MQIYRLFIFIIILCSGLIIDVAFAKDEESFNSIVQREGRLVRIYIPSIYQNKNFYGAKIITNRADGEIGMLAELKTIDLNEVDEEYKSFHLATILLDEELEDNFIIKVMYKKTTSESFSGCYIEVDILLNRD